MSEKNSGETPTLDLKVLLGKGNWTVFTPNTAVSMDREYEIAEIEAEEEEDEKNE